MLEFEVSESAAMQGKWREFYEKLRFDMIEAQCASNPAASPAHPSSSTQPCATPEEPATISRTNERHGDGRVNGREDNRKTPNASRFP